MLVYESTKAAPTVSKDEAAHVDKDLGITTIIPMSRVTRKLQVSVPKVLADQFAIRPGDDLEWEAAGDVLRVIPPRARISQRARSDRLALFDEATKRQEDRQARRSLSRPTDRGWSRDELYERSERAR